MRTIAVITGGRADFGIYRPLLRAILAHPALRLRLWVTGMHLAPEFGLTVGEIEREGFAIDARLPILEGADTPAATATAMGRALEGFGRLYAQDRPDLLVALGDRFEMAAAVLAAVPFGLPIAHIAGGSVTLGAMDDVFRHMITKAAHLHFAETDAHARRIVQMGEAPDRVTVTGALGLDNLRLLPRLSPAELERRWAIPIAPPPLLVTLHPETRAEPQAANLADAVLPALAAAGRPTIFTAPNADHGGRALLERLQAHVAATPTAQLVPSLGTQGYFSLMAHAAAMVGNSSSGLVEAPSLKLPVVNVGSRQQGRLRAANVIDVEARPDAVAAGLRRALDPAFRRALAALVNPYGDGHAAERMVRVLAETPLEDNLVRKEFHDLP